MEQVTQILDAINAGNGQAAEELLPVLYEELRRLAAAKMAQQAPGQTLQATALVHEAWLKLTARNPSRWRDRQHFFRAAAQAMRRILIDRARQRLRLRHGQGQQRVGLEDIQIAAPEKDEVLVQLDEALAELRAVSPERAEIVNLRFFAGLGETEIADILGVSERSVQRQWSYARAWLFTRIGTRKTS